MESPRNQSFAMKQFLDQEMAARLIADHAAFDPNSPTDRRM